MLEDDPLVLVLDDFGTVDELSSSEGDRRLLFVSRATPILKNDGVAGCSIWLCLKRPNIFF